MSKTMTQQSYDKILEAAKILCEYCQVTRLTDDAYLDATEEGIIDDA